MVAFFTTEKQDAPMRNAHAYALSAVLGLSLQALVLPADAAATLTIWAFPHDELADLSDEQLRQDYFEPWLTEMREITRVPVTIHFQRRLPGLTDIAYRQVGSSAVLSVWSDAAFSWRRKHNSPGGLVDNKYLLLVRDELGDSDAGPIAGLAYQTGYAAIASLKTYATVGHELGHTLSATHEQSSVNFNGWFCETYMFPTRLSLRSNCYRYSDENRQNIGNYLKALH